MNEDRLKIAVFIDFDNIEIGVKSTLNRHFDIGAVLEAIKERSLDTHVAGGQMRGINIDPAGGQPYGGALNHHRLTSDLCLYHGQALRERMIGMSRGRVRPQQVGEVIPRELLTAFQGETDEEREMLARAKPHLLASEGEQGGSTESVQHEMVSHMPARVLLIRNGTLGGRINDLSTR